MTAATPTFSRAGGYLHRAQTVTISDADGRRDHPLHHQRNHTDHFVRSLFRADHGKFVGDPGSHCGGDGYTNSAVAAAAYTISPRRHRLRSQRRPSLPRRVPTPGADSDHLRCHRRRNHLLHHQRNDANHFIHRLFRADHGKFVGDAGGDCGSTGDTNSAVASAAYTISSVPPTAQRRPSHLRRELTASAQTVTISDATAGATIYYTTNGSTPTTSSTPYTAPITVSASETLEAIAAVAGDTSSAVASAAYTISSSAPSPTVSAPTFTPPAGAFTSAQTVTISDATSGATIYYTTNGTTPTTSSSPYSGPITVSATETLEAIAAVKGDTNSAVASAAYTISSVPPTVSTPTFTPPAGAYASAQTVSISDATAGATIYYTTDGTTPTTSSSPYTAPITVSATETLETIAAVTGDTSSAVASAAYTIPSHPDFILSTSLPSLTVNSGGQGALTLTVTPVNGFDSPVTFACSGLPSGATCSFDQETVIPSGEVATTQLTISTSAQSSALHRESRPFFPLTVVAMTVCFFGWRKRRGASDWMLPAIAFASLGLLLGCGIFRGSLTPPTSATSTVTVMATSGTMQQKATITLTVE